MGDIFCKCDHAHTIIGLIFLNTGIHESGVNWNVEIAKRLTLTVPEYSKCI